MKRIEFIAPVEAIRGNLSGAQKLRYPTNDQGAYEGPVGSVNYARNYTPRFVGAKVAKSGLKYFSVRTKSANHLTAKSKKAMALLGGAGAIYAAILKEATLLAGIRLQYTKLQELGSTKTFREYVMDVIRKGLVEHAAQFVFAGPASPVNVDNPWGKFDGAPLNISISDAIRVKFWTELAAGGFEFTVDGMKGIAISNDSFTDLSGMNYNVLSLAIDSNEHVRLGSATGAYLLLNGAYVGDVDDVMPDAYTTTTVAPE